MNYLKINDVDYSGIVSGLKVGFETLVSDKSGRNAAGNSVVDVINKKFKVYVTFRHTTDAEMSKLLKEIEGFVVNITFLNPKTQALTTVQAYTGTPEPEYYTISDKTIFKPMSLNFVEL